MANKNSEKNIGGAVSTELADKFAAYVKKKKFKQKKLFKSFCLWFMSIDDDQQQALYDFDIGAEVKTSIKSYLSSPEGKQLLIDAIREVGKRRK